MQCKLFGCFILLAVLCILHASTLDDETEIGNATAAIRGIETPRTLRQGRKKKMARLIKKHLKRLRKEEGGIKLVGGRGEYEGKFVSFYLHPTYGLICIVNGH